MQVSLNRYCSELPNNVRRIFCELGTPLTEVNWNSPIIGDENEIIGKSGEHRWKAYRNAARAYQVCGPHYVAKE